MRISDWSSDVCSSDLVADQLIVAGLGHHRHAVDHAFGNAVAAIGGHAHGHPFAVAAQQPVVDVVDGGVGGGGRGGQAARFDDGGAALADGGDEAVAVPGIKIGRAHV